MTQSGIPADFKSGVPFFFGTIPQIILCYKLGKEPNFSDGAADYAGKFMYLSQKRYNSRVAKTSLRQ